MSASWTVTGVGFDEEPRDVHTVACAVWTSNDDCNCGSFDHGVEQLVNLFESYARPQADRADGAA